MEVPKRLEWLDIAKGILISFIVIGHIDIDNSVYKVFHTFINIFQVSLFFVISGYTLNEEKLKKPSLFLANKIKTLYLPLLSFYVVFTLLHNFLINIGVYDINQSYSGKIMTYYSLKDIVIILLKSIFMLNKEPICGPLWFMCVLIESMVLLSILFYISDKLKLTMAVTYTIIILLFVIAYGLTNYGYTIHRVSNVPTACICILIGMEIKKHKIRFDSIYVFICSTVLLLSSLFNNTLKISFNANIIGNPMYFIFATLCSVYMLFYVCKKIEKKSILSIIMTKIGRASLYIMVMHLLAFKVPIYLINRNNLCNLRANVNSLFGFTTVFLSGILLPMLIYSLRNLICRKLTKK